MQKGEIFDSHEIRIQYNDWTSHFTESLFGALYKFVFITGKGGNGMKFALTLLFFNSVQGLDTETKI